MLAWLCPGRLKCDPVDLSTIFCLTYPRCSARRYFRARFVCPMNRNLQLNFSHSIKCIILYDSHVCLLFKVNFSFSFILKFFLLKCMGRQCKTCRTFLSPLFVFLHEFLDFLVPWHVSKGFGGCFLF